MSPSRLFILRPVATSLLMIGLLLVGIVAYRELPVSALPQVDYPTIQITTFYPGAGPEVMASSVTAPMERQFGQLPGLSLEDLRATLGQANVDQAKGVLEGPRQSFTIGSNDQLLSSADYKNVILAYRNGAPVRLTDVATVIDGAENSKQAAWMNLSPAVIVNIQRQPGANIISVVDRIKKVLPQLQSAMGNKVNVSILTDRTETIRASVKDVQFEMMLTVALVVMVIFLFLRNLSA